MALPGVHHHAAGQSSGLSPLSTVLAMAGGALAVYGLRRNDWPGALLAIAGGGLFAGTLPSRSHFRHSPEAVIPAREGVRIDETIVVDRPVALVYGCWRRYENLPLFMKHLVDVRQTGETTSHWVARGPAGFEVEWDAELINDIENELIAWKTISHSDVENAGSVHFQSLNDDSVTRVHVELKYNPPAGKLGAAFAKLLGEDPRKQVREALERFKEMIEAEEFKPSELEVLKKYSHPQPIIQRTPKKDADDVVEEASEESFPASDAPSWRDRSH
jgi:uncharacterized membrane protein